MRRIDPDYEDRETHRIYVESGNGVFQKWMLGIVSLLVVAASVGGVTMYAKLATIETRLNYLEIQCYRAK